MRIEQEKVFSLLESINEAGQMLNYKVLDELNSIEE